MASRAEPVVRDAEHGDVAAICRFGEAHIRPHYAPLIGAEVADEQVRRWWNETHVGAAVAEGVVVVAEAAGRVVGVGQRGRKGEPTSSSAHERLDGFRRCFDDDPPVLLGRFDPSWGLEAAARLLEEGWRAGTIVAAADVIAIGLLSRLQSAGFSVPEDFRVVGFDGVGVARLAHPTLTTVRQPVEAMSQAIRSLAEAAVAGTVGTPSIERISPELVVGESSPAR